MTHERQIENQRLTIEALQQANDLQSRRILDLQDRLKAAQQEIAKLKHKLEVNIWQVQ